MNNSINNAPILDEISKFISNFRYQSINEETLKQSMIVCADTYATAFSGINTDSFITALKSCELNFGKDDFEIWGTEKTTSLLGSIFYNSLAISSTDFDEGHRKAVGHPASAVVPVAIILGDFLKKSKIEILKSIIIGYEIGTRFSMSRVKSKITTYSTGRWSAISTATTAAYLLELTANKTMQALSNAAVLSPAMLGGSTDVSTGSMSKEGVAWAAQTGVQSAFMANDGFTGPYLFVDEYDDYDKDTLLKDLGSSFFIDSNYFKPYSCCRWLHSAINATELIYQNNKFEIEEIEKIEVLIFARALNLVADKYPDNTVKAQFHLPFVIALMLIEGRVSPELFQNENLNNESIYRIIDKIDLIANENYTKSFPATLPSRVKIILVNGKSFKQEVLIAPWENNHHPSIKELKQKFDFQVSAHKHISWTDFLSL